jgi:hypothetical protein
VPAVRGELDDPAAALLAEVWQRRADQRDGAGEIGGDDVVDLGVGQFLGCAEQAVAGVADDHVDPAQLVVGAVDQGSDRARVGDVEELHVEGVGMLLGQVGDGVGAADGADDGVAAVEQLAGEFAAEAAADSGDEPGPGCHEDSLFWAGATSSRMRRALSVRG